jgi:methanogenic corrinoid protein MtbC1
MRNSLGIELQTAEAIRERRVEIARAVVELHYQNQPQLWDRYGEEGRRLCLRDVDYHLDYLIESVRVSDPTLFQQYLAWLTGLFANMGLPERTVPDMLDYLKKALKAILEEATYQEVELLMDKAASSPLQTGEGSLGSGIERLALTEIARRYVETLLQGNRAAARGLILDAADSGTAVADIYLTVLQPAQREIGRLWYQQEISVADEHFCTAATQLIMSELYPLVFNTPKSGRRMVAACAEGELHEIGIRMVADFFEMAGWDTYYLGANMPVSDIVGTVSSKRADVLAVSATLAVRRPALARLVSQVRASSAGDRVKIIIGGGATFSRPQLCQEIGAHGCAGDAQEALELVERLLPHQG